MASNAQIDPVPALVASLNTALCTHGVEPVSRSRELHARWDIPGVDESEQWTVPKVRIKPNREETVTIIQLGLKVHRSSMELSIDEDAAGRDQKVVDPPMGRTELHLGVRVWEDDEDEGDVGHFFGSVQVWPCEVGLLLSIAEAMFNVAVAYWPKEPGKKVLKWDNQVALDKLMFPGQLTVGHAEVIGMLKIVFDAKKGLGVGGEFDENDNGEWDNGVYEEGRAEHDMA
ncbi:hypothetical protein PRZ48_008938 [Zasmidium cellare]|uniref:Uncharacterized protein n=1 Tax=Zasmidium cellare TaxID=395010 RepID=A0ABR0EHS6_ZASCE|nr:hypothetical protein PRZ48_008938 [Zasmidium cellare]